MFEYLEQIEGALNFTTFLPPESGYVRHLLEKTADFELYCILWSEGAETPFHCHPDGGCWMRVIEGELQESTLTEEKLLTKGDTGFQKGAYGIHKITAKQASKSLHLYKPAALASGKWQVAI